MFLRGIVHRIRLLSVTNTSAGSRTAAAGNVGAAIAVHVAVHEPMLSFVTEIH